MLTTAVNYKVQGLRKEEVIAEFDNLMPYEQIEVLDELNRKTKYSCALSRCSMNDLYNEIARRGEGVAYVEGV